MHRSNPPWPRVTLVTDARSDAGLERAVRALPRGSGVVFRHYHLAPAARRARFRQVRAFARRFGHRIALSGPPALARRWGADAAYGPPARLVGGPPVMRLVTVHDLAELARANIMRCDAVLLSPVFPTGSHPGAAALGPARARLIGARALAPVIALGGMNAHRARRHGFGNWAAIEALAR